MHVALINPGNEFYSPVSGGAIATILWQTARELLRRGHEVSVLTPVNADPTYPDGRIAPVRAPGRRDLNLVQRAISRLSDRVNVWEWPYYERYLAAVLGALDSLPGPPDAIMCYNDLVTPTHLRRRLPQCRLLANLQNEIRLRNRDPRYFENIDRIIACSGYIQRWTAAEYNLPPGKVEVMESGVDLDAFCPRDDFLAPRKPLRVLFVGRIDRNKGPDIAADAVAALRREGAAVELSVAGGLWFYGHGQENTDPYFIALKQKMEAAEANYLGHVTRDAIGGVFRAHDVACVLSRSEEPFGLVTLEAMASGCAVLASNRGGIPDACGSAGVLLDPEDFAAVTGALRHFCDDPAALSQSKSAGRAHALRCSWASRVDELQKFL